MEFPTPSCDTLASRAASAQSDSTSAASLATTPLRAFRVCSKRPRPQKQAATKKRSWLRLLFREPPRGAKGAARFRTCRKWAKAFPHSLKWAKTTAFPSSARGELPSSFSAASNKISARLSSSSLEFCMWRAKLWKPFAMKASGPLAARLACTRSACSSSVLAFASEAEHSSGAGGGTERAQLTWWAASSCMVVARSGGRLWPGSTSRAASRTRRKSSSCRSP
mmetsp:Transcript_91316/g.258655  ORF Transcript_91316/g.258655 Transcript_91316/m.258655 type:complete len:223 (+) Transcript_91316:1659-2327(+)